MLCHLQIQECQHCLAELGRPKFWGPPAPITKSNSSSGHFPASLYIATP